MNFKHRRRRGATEINLTPLIDIVFNLLIFFLITTTFVQNAGIDVELPKAAASTTPQQDSNIVVAVTAEGRIVVAGNALSQEELAEHLQRHQQKHKDATLIIQADELAHHGKVVQVMDIARRVGLRRLAIAAEVRE